MTQNEILKILFEEASKELDKSTEFKHGRTSGKMEAYSHAYTLVKKLTIPVVKNWVAVKDALPDNCDQVFVKYENGRYGINEWWESDDCWKYQFDNMIVKEWCKPPCS